MKEQKTSEFEELVHDNQERLIATFGKEASLRSKAPRKRARIRRRVSAGGTVADGNLVSRRMEWALVYQCNYRKQLRRPSSPGTGGKEAEMVRHLVTFARAIQGLHAIQNDPDGLQRWRSSSPIGPLWIRHTHVPYILR